MEPDQDLNLHPIPEIFRKHEDGMIFRHCFVCDKELIESKSSYIIEKGIHKASDGVDKMSFEFVCCQNCAQSFQSQLSKESQTAMFTYLLGNYNSEWRDKRKQLSHYKLFEIDYWLDVCMFKNTPKEELEDYQICAAFEGDQLLYGETPFLVSEMAADEILNLLSNATLDSYNDFFGNINDLPPGVEDWTKKPVLI